MSLRVCNIPGCPELTATGRCTTHQREADKARGTRAQRGYGPAHKSERRRWQRTIDATGWPCSRCGHIITSGDAWHLDHTDDRASYRGPSCATCNLSAAGQRSHTQ